MKSKILYSPKIIPGTGLDKLEKQRWEEKGKKKSGVFFQVQSISDSLSRKIENKHLNTF